MPLRLRVRGPTEADHQALIKAVARGVLPVEHG